MYQAIHNTDHFLEEKKCTAYVAIKKHFKVTIHLPKYKKKKEKKTLIVVYMYIADSPKVVHIDKYSSKNHVTQFSNPLM
jgi:uncharacterized cysteine cluster protein YcgN (CxxCxxCC family)